MPNEFLDVELPSTIPGYPCISSPRTSTTIARSDSGREKINRNWVHPLHTFRLPDAIRAHAAIEDLRDHWMVMYGPFTAFPFRDPLDFASVHLAQADQTPTVTDTDQQIGVGDGATVSYQLSKTYTRGANTYVRPIVLPRTGTVVVAVNGVSQPSGWTITRPGGVITFSSPPTNTHVITAGYLFDVPVRFATDDDFESILRSYNVSGFADITLVEKRLCL